MAGLTPEQIPDLILATHEALPIAGEFDSTIELQSYPALSMLFDKNKRKTTGGRSISKRVQLRNSNHAQNVGLFEVTDNTFDNTVEEIVAPWIHSEVKMHHDVREIDMNSGPAEILDLIKTRRFDAYEALCNWIENQCFGVPEDANDSKTAYGFPYWICPMAPGTSDSAGGFNGTTVAFGDGSTSTTTAGIDRNLTRNRRFRNWNATYSDFGPSVLEQMRKACRYINFDGPKVLKRINKSEVPAWGIYSDLDKANEYESIVNAGPDDRNGDYSPFNGQLSFKRIPWYGAAALNSISYEPIYIINHRCLYPYVLRDRWMKEGKPLNDVDAHNVITIPVDCSWQMFCKNVRGGGAVIHKPISA